MIMMDEVIERTSALMYRTDLAENCILMYFEVLSTVLLALKALVLLLDPLSGQMETPLAMLRDEKRLREKEAGPNRSIPLTFLKHSILSPHQTKLHIFTQNRVKE